MLFYAIVYFVGTFLPPVFFTIFPYALMDHWWRGETRPTIRKMVLLGYAVAVIPWAVYLAVSGFYSWQLGPK